MFTPTQWIDKLTRDEPRIIRPYVRIPVRAGNLRTLYGWTQTIEVRRPKRIRIEVKHV